MRRTRAIMLLALAVAAGGCAIISVEDYVGNGVDALPVEAGATDAAQGRPDDAAASDAGADATPTVILTQTIPFATGRAQQSHLFYSKAAGRWVFFTFDNGSTKRLATRLSADFTTWSDGAPLDLPQDSERDGRNLAVAALPSADNVFHLSMSLASGISHSHHHVRAALGGDLVYGGIVKLGDSMVGQIDVTPDGPAVVAIADGRVVDVSGYTTPPDGGYGIGNFIPWVSTDADNGSTWTPSFSAPFQLETVAQACNARALVTLGLGALSVYESADVEPRPHGLHTVTFDGMAWSGFTDVGFENATFDVNDWSVAALGAAIHVVRRGDTYSHRVFQNGKFGPGVAMVDGAHAAGSGLVLLPDKGILRAYTLDPDGAILTASFQTTWSAWSEILAKGATRASLTGYNAGDVAALSWVEEKPDGLAVVGWQIR